jgi:hypothetical protein
MTPSGPVMVGGVSAELEATAGLMVVMVMVVVSW